jgi:diaminohydroxyphosphoribosylaminopyrimidine deaminase/5-amino-6-(5-phosphoribosylamino)uracil reductase
MRLALQLARRGAGTVSPNPMVGAVLVKGGKVIGRGWHRRAGQAHAEIEALNDARKKRQATKGSALYVTLEPCSTHGRTPPCTAAVIKAGIKEVHVGALDPNPRHNGRGLKVLQRSGVKIVQGLLGQESQALNDPFNHWITEGTPLVTVKAAMTLDGKIATRTGESKWITGEKARACGMRLREISDAVLVGVNTIIADNPGLTVRSKNASSVHRLLRFVLDTQARTPPKSAVVSDQFSALTTIVVGREAPKKRVEKLRARVKVMVAPTRRGRIDLRWLMKKMGAMKITSLLVEGGGEVNASFLMENLAQRIAFFYAPKILGGRESLPGVAGRGASAWTEIVRLEKPSWLWLGKDLLLSARLRPPTQQP